MTRHAARPLPSLGVNLEWMVEKLRAVGKAPLFWDLIIPSAAQKHFALSKFGLQRNARQRAEQLGS